ncbi:MAG: sugar ABC transporter ATP-binding protein [Pirellulaceae bacterium]
MQNVSLQVAPGKVHAVIGENGAGKSTLMKILAGVHEPDSGEILLDAKPVRIDSVSTALSLGIALIHQELNLSDNLDVGANIFLGREPLRFGLIDRGEIRRQSKLYLEMVGLEVDPDTRVGELTIGMQQMVEIAKALSVDARILIMDEPTSSLSQHETLALYKVIRKLCAQGVTIIYISHRLGEIEELAHAVTVLRDGENAGDLNRAEINHNAMVQRMVGRDISQFYTRTKHTLGDPILEVRGLRTRTWPAHELNFKVHAGEMVGVAGLVGAGRTEMLSTIFGTQPALSGDVLVDDRPLRLTSCRDAIAAGIAMVPEDRKQQGLILEMGIRNNIGLPSLDRHALGGTLLNRSRERSDSNRMMAEMKIKAATDLQQTQYLSGGNQQKVVIGKWLSMDPKVLLLDEPTRGVDIGAKQEIYRLMEQLAQQGVAVLFVSSEMEEVLSMSDRVLVMHEGRISGQLTADQLSESAVMQLATGGVGNHPKSNFAETESATL